MQSSKERWNPDCLEHSRDAFGSILPLQFSSLQRGCKSSPGPGQSRILQEMQGGRQRAAVSSQRCQPSSCRAHPQLPGIPGGQGAKPGQRGSEQRLQQSRCQQLPSCSSSLGFLHLLQPRSRMAAGLGHHFRESGSGAGPETFLEQAVFSCSCQAAQAAALTGWDVGEEPREHWKKLHVQK